MAVGLKRKQNAAKHIPWSCEKCLGLMVFLEFSRCQVVPSLLASLVNVASFDPKLVARRHAANSATSRKNWNAPKQPQDTGRSSC